MAASTLYDTAVQRFLDGEYDFFDSTSTCSFVKDIDYWIMSCDGQKICMYPRPAKDMAIELIRMQPFF